MANTHRGEVDICLAGTHYTLRPTFQALCELEQRSGSSLYAIAKKFEAGDFTVHDVACIIWSGIKGAGVGEGLSLEHIGECVVKEGLANCVPPVCRYIAGALGADLEPEYAGF